jgi:hypothetical protein
LTAEQLDAIQINSATPLGGGDEDRRRSPRSNYPAIQLLAPFDGHLPPSKIDFCQVRCYDISQGGLSFLWPEPPAFRYLVIGLDSTLGRVWVKAQVMRHRPIAGLNGEFHVSCRFLGRVDCCW